MEEGEELVGVRSSDKHGATANNTSPVVKPTVLSSLLWMDGPSCGWIGQVVECQKQEE